MFFVVVGCMYTCKTGNFNNKPLGEGFFVGYCMYTPRLVILETSLRVYVCVVIDGMYTYKTGNISKKNFCLCLYCCRVYLHM